MNHALLKNTYNIGALPRNSRNNHTRLRNAYNTGARPGSIRNEPCTTGKYVQYLGIAIPTHATYRIVRASPHTAVPYSYLPSAEEPTILPLPQFHSTVRVRLRAVAAEALPVSSLVPKPIGTAGHALAMPPAALIHLPLIPAPSILPDLDLRGRSAHTTSRHPPPQTATA